MTWFNSTTTTIINNPSDTMALAFILFILGIVLTHFIFNYGI